MSVVVVTRDRPGDLEVCLKAVLSSTLQDFELIVVDQSIGPDTAELVKRTSVVDTRVRYVRDTGAGAARARNVGIVASTGTLVVFTDDDCEPEATWLTNLIQPVLADEDVGIAFGAVLPAPHDTAAGFIVGFRPRHRSRLTGRLSKLRDQGISANLLLRRTAIEVAGGFDEMLGPGSYFPCAEDFDLTYRVLSHGFALLHLPEARVVHHGLRDWRSGSRLVYQTYVAIGAAYMKHVRARDVVGLLLLGEEFFFALANIAIKLAQGRRPFGFGRLRGLLEGICRSFELGVDWRVPLYSPRDCKGPA